MSLATRLAWIGGAVALASYAAVAGPKGLVHFVGGREMLVENLGAFVFLATSIVFFLLGRRERGSVSTWRLVQVVGLGAFFFVAFGEEASWGQHWLGFDTPEELKQINAQQETNLHNLWLIDSYEGQHEKKTGLAALLLNSNRLFDLIMVGLFWLLPLAGRLKTPLRALLGRLETPIPAWPFAVLLLGNYLLTGLAEKWLVDGMFRHLAVSEIREFNYATLGLLAAIELLRRSGAAATADKRQI